MQAEVDRLEGLVDAEAARADYILDAAEENIEHLCTGPILQPDSLDLTTASYSAG